MTTKAKLTATTEPSPALKRALALTITEAKQTQDINLDRGEIAYLLSYHGYQTAKGTLAKLACVGGGPRYRIFGNKAFYTPAWAIAWAESRMSEPRTNTSEAEC